MPQNDATNQTLCQGTASPNIPYFRAYKIPVNNVAKIPELLNQTQNSVRFKNWKKDDNCSTLAERKDHGM